MNGCSCAPAAREKTQITISNHSFRIFSSLRRKYMRVPTFSRSEVCEFLIVFRGVTDRLIPLFAVGAFLAFTFSQAGMVGHWRRTRDKRARDKMIISGVGATATGITVLLVMTSKFVEGAWITLVAIPAILLVMYAVRGHYDRAGRELASSSPLSTHDLCPPIV